MMKQQAVKSKYHQGHKRTAKTRVSKTKSHVLTAIRTIFWTVIIVNAVLMAPWIVLGIQEVVAQATK